MKANAVIGTTLMLCFSVTSLAAGELTDHQVMVDCNRSASGLLESYDSQLKSLKESRRLDLLGLVSDTCQSGYKAARDGMQQKDIQRYLSNNADNSGLPTGLMLDAVQRGYSIYNDQ